MEIEENILGNKPDDEFIVDCLITYIEGRIAENVAQQYEDVLLAAKETMFGLWFKKRHNKGHSLQSLARKNKF
jgi:hypothetical protein